MLKAAESQKVLHFGSNLQKKVPNHYPEHYPSTEKMIRMEIWQIFFGDIGQMGKFWIIRPPLNTILDLRNFIVNQGILLEFFLNQDLPVHRWSWIPIWSSMMIHLKSHCLLGTPRGQDPLKNWLRNSSN